MSTTTNESSPDDLSARVLHARADRPGPNPPLANPTRTFAVRPGDPVLTARVAPGDELCIRNDSGRPVGVIAEPDPAMLGDWVDGLERERDRLAARVAELERENAALMGLLVVPYGGRWAAHYGRPRDGDDGTPELQWHSGGFDSEPAARAWVRAAAGLDADGEGVADE